MSLNFPKIFLDSSAVEHPAVNRRVVGSNPTRGAKKKDITLSGVFFLPIAGFRLRRVVGDAIADLRFSEEVETEMSEQSLFRRFAPYKPYSGSQKNGLKVKCWGADCKISQYNILAQCQMLGCEI